MLSTTPLPQTGEVFLDGRGGERSMRVTWHPEADLVVLSLWHGQLCAGSFRLAREDIPRLIALLRSAHDTIDADSEI